MDAKEETERENEGEREEEKEEDYEEKLGFRVVEEGDLVCTLETDEASTACKIAIEQFYENYFRAIRERSQRSFGWKNGRKGNVEIMKTGKK